MEEHLSFIFHGHDLISFKVSGHQTRQGKDLMEALREPNLSSVEQITNDKEDQ